MRRTRNGFTLIEIVVAVAIFAVIVSIVFPALMQFLDMRERIEQKHDELTTLQKVFLFMSNDMRYAANRLGKDEYGERGKTTMSIGDDSLIDMTGLYPDINLDGLSVPRRIRWELDDTTLKRIQYPVMDPDSDTRTITQTLLTGVEDIEIEVSFVEDGRESVDDKWEEQNRLPDMVTIKLELESGVEYARHFIMTGGDNKDAVAAAAVAGVSQGNPGDGGSGDGSARSQDENEGR